MNEREEVDKLIEKYKTANPFELCEKMNINLKYSELGSLRGFYRYSRKNHFIEINKNLGTKERYATCSHELGHCTMHQGMNGIFLSTTLMLPTKLERQADKFSLYLLMKYYDGTVDEIPSRLLNYLRS